MKDIILVMIAVVSILGALLVTLSSRGLQPTVVSAAHLWQPSTDCGTLSLQQRPVYLERFQVVEEVGGITIRARCTNSRVLQYYYPDEENTNAFPK